jgi:hypothetical protein
MKELISLGRELFPAVHRLEEGDRARIARQAAALVGTGGWLAGLLGQPVVWARRPGFASALAAALLIAVAAVPIALRDVERPAPGDASAPPRIDRLEMTALAGGAVHLAWSNGRKDSYTVTKSSDPRGLEGAERHVVTGHDWIDAEAGQERIVFYRID